MGGSTRLNFLVFSFLCLSVRRQFSEETLSLILLGIMIFLVLLSQERATTSKYSFTHRCQEIRENESACNETMFNCKDEYSKHYLNWLSFPYLSPRSPNGHSVEGPLWANPFCNTFVRMARHHRFRKNRHDKPLYIQHDQPFTLLPCFYPPITHLPAIEVLDSLGGEGVGALVCRVLTSVAVVLQSVVLKIGELRSVNQH